MILFYLLVYVFESIIAYVYFSDNYEIKIKLAYSILLSLGLYLIGFAVNYIDKNSLAINLLTFFIINVVYCKLSFNISWISGIFHSSILLAIMFISEMIVEYIASYLLNIPIDAYKNSLSALIILGITCKALYLIICKLISLCFSYKRNNAVNDMKKAFMLFLYPVMITVTLTLLFYVSSYYSLSKRINMICAVISVLSLALCCFIFIYNQALQKQENEFAELKTQQMKNEIDMQYLDLLEMKNREMQILTHDYKNHLAAIRDMSSSEEVAEYIDKMNDEIKTANSACHSGNHTLDILINKYVTECYSKNIDFTFDVKLCNLSYVESFDLVTILGNALDNALESAEKSEAKKISFLTKRVNTYDTVIIENSCDNPPDSKLKTTKKNKGSHGLGMKSIAKTLKKYGGDYEWEYSQTDKQFKLTIILQNK